MYLISPFLCHSERLHRSKKAVEFAHFTRHLHIRLTARYHFSRDFLPTRPAVTVRLGPVKKSLDAALVCIKWTGHFMCVLHSFFRTVPPYRAGTILNFNATRHVRLSYQHRRRIQYRNEKSKFYKANPARANVAISLLLFARVRAHPYFMDKGLLNWFWRSLLWVITVTVYLCKHCWRIT